MAHHVESMGETLLTTPNIINMAHYQFFHLAHTIPPAPKRPLGYLSLSLSTLNSLFSP